MYLQFGFFTIIITSVFLVTGCSHTPEKPIKQTQAPTPQPQQPKSTVYIVQQGDTLSSIARRFNVPTQDLQHLNSINNPRTLSIGTRLTIPGNIATGYAFIWPLNKLDVSSEFGARNHRHKGIDLRAPSGTSIRAAACGVVIFVGRQNGYGKTVIVQHLGDIKTLYAHNQKNLVNKGQQVKQGELIATIGNSGNASGYHVHFEYIQAGRQLNPRHYISNI